MSMLVFDRDVGDGHVLSVKGNVLLPNNDDEDEDGLENGL
jgi:hypothetical protein